MHPPEDASRKEGRGAVALQAGFLLAVLAAEMAAFLVGTARHYAWLYPRRHDQVQYLAEVYAAYEAHFRQGWLAALGRSLAETAPQGTLHRPLALLAFWLAGPSRLSALGLNMAAFGALQAAFFVAARRLWSSWPLAWIAVGLLAAVALPWSGAPGSATDFRLDWLAACGYGIALAAAWTADDFRSAGGAARFGAAVAGVLLLRFLTGAYLALVYLGLALWIARGPARSRRWLHLALSGALAAALAGWAFWRSRARIHEYYFVNHFSGPERELRDSHVAGLAAVRWLGGQVAANLGLGPLLATGLGLGAIYLGRDRRRPPAALPARRARAAGGLAALFLAAPCLVMFFQPEKASQVMSITIPGAVGLLLVAWARGLGRIPGRAAGGLAAAVLAAGLSFLTARVLARSVPLDYETHARSVSALGDFLFFRAEEAGLTAPAVAVTGVSDGVGAAVLRVEGFERHGRTLPFVARLPPGLLAVPEAQIAEALVHSDFVCLLTQGRLRFPIDQEFAALAAAERQWCEAHLRFDGTVTTGILSVAVFERTGLERPAGGVSLEQRVREALAEADPAGVPPPPPARLRPLQPVLWSRAAPLHLRLPGVYSPLRYQAGELPPGLVLDARTGELSGTFPYPGRFAFPVGVSNPRGADRQVVEFEVGDQDFAAACDLAPGPAGGGSFLLNFRACATDGTLDFIDLVDLTAAKMLVRLAAVPEQKAVWQGSYAGRVGDDGVHHLQMRFVRYLPGQADPHPYLDRSVYVGRDRGAPP